MNGVFTTPAKLPGGQCDRAGTVQRPGQTGGLKGSICWWKVLSLPYSFISFIDYPSRSQGLHHVYFLQRRSVYLLQSDQYSSTSSIKRAFTRFPLTMNLPIRVAARSFRKDSLEAPTHLGLLVPPWTTTTEFITLSKISVLIQTSCPKICWSAIKSDFF